MPMSHLKKKKANTRFQAPHSLLAKKNAGSTNANNEVDNHTRFPASSLSKIVFTYLVLQLAKKNYIDLDEPLFKTLQYQRFLVNGRYPEKATKLTARHVLSHTTGLPNFGTKVSSTLLFDSKIELGKEYSYSGEAFLYLQNVIEIKMGSNLEMLAQEYVFTPLGMSRSTFSPQPKDDNNIVSVHTQLEKSTAIYEGNPPLNAAGSLLTTASDFAKFIIAWLTNMDDPIIQQAFKPTSSDEFMTCGLGWHMYKNADEMTAYQYGENPNTRAFIAINVKDKKGAVFFTNSENGMSIANQIFSSPDLAPIANMQAIFEHLHYDQSDKPGWKETIAGKIAENKKKFKEAKQHFENALEESPRDKSKQRRLTWFNAAHQSTSDKQTFVHSLKLFTGKFSNRYNDEIDISIKESHLLYRQFGHNTTLVRISDTEFLPEKDQSFKISFDLSNNQATIIFIHGAEKHLSKQPSSASQAQTSSYASIAKSLGHQPNHQPQTKANDIPTATDNKHKSSVNHATTEQQRGQDDMVKGDEKTQDYKNHRPR